MGRCVLAIDLGSSGVKVAVVDPEGVVRGGAGEGLPTVLVAGDGAEQDPAVWWEAIGRCSRRALQTSGTAAADDAYHFPRGYAKGNTLEDIVNQQSSISEPLKEKLKEKLSLLPGLYI